METQFIAAKIFYDEREYLPAYLKYSKNVSRAEHSKYIRKYEEEGIGGWGFHECMNFDLSKDPVRYYLPPTSYPKRGIEKFGELCIFFFTYKPYFSIVGVQGVSTIVDKHGILRPGKTSANDTKLTYNALGERDYATLFVPPLSYSVQGSKYSPGRFSQGFRYLSKTHAARILSDAKISAENQIKTASNRMATVVRSEILVIERIQNRYNLMGNRGTPEPAPNSWFGGVPSSDPVLGKKGEKYIYDREKAYAKKLGLEKDVDWTARRMPYSPYDIKSVRKTGKEISEVYIEVKSTTWNDYSNVHISAAQIEFATAHSNSYIFKLLKFTNKNSSNPKVETFSIHDLHSKFTVKPTAYKLTSK